MFFTQEDYKKIQNYLTQHAVRDTDLNNASTPFDGNEVITIVQNDENKKVLLKDLVSQIFDLGIYDFINITDRYDAPNITLEEAISYIPVKARKKGQVITFLNDEDKWQIYQFKGALNQWNIPDQWQDLFDWEKLIPKVITADEVFLTQTEPDEHGTSYLTLKDKRYRPSEYSGLGKIILKKNIVTFEPEIGPAYKRNILYQDMFVQSNTVYEIHYDFDLDGKDIVLPDNSYIEYVGGSITNGNIIDNAGGLKTVILRKNMVGDKNVLTQDMVNTPNTIYEIRYDFDLNGAEITTPENCVLKFEGGSLGNGSIIGDSTTINAPLSSIFSNDVSLAGSWTGLAQAEWFGAIGDGNNDDTVYLQKCFDAFRDIKLKQGATYKVTCQKVFFSRKYALSVKSNTSIDLNGSTIRLADNQNGCVIINAQAQLNSSDIVNRNIKILNGTIDHNCYNQSTHSNHVLSSLYLWGVEDCCFDNLIINNGYCYAFYIRNSKTITIGSIKVNHAIGGGISILNVEDIKVGIAEVYNVNRFPVDLEGCFGNPLVCTAHNAVIGDIVAKNCFWGVKIQDESSDITVNNIIVEGGENTDYTTISGPVGGVKLQGNSASEHTLSNIRINRIIVKNFAQGLYINSAINVSINNYEGSGNGICQNQASFKDYKVKSDVYITNSNTITINTILSKNSIYNTIWAQRAVYGLKIGQLNIIKDTQAPIIPNGNLCQFQDTKNISVKGISVYDTSNNKLWNRIILLVLSNIIIDSISSTTTPESWDYIQVYDDESKLHVGKINIGSECTMGIITPTPNTNTAKVENGNIIHTERLRTIINVAPINAEACNILESGVVYAKTKLGTQAFSIVYPEFSEKRSPTFMWSIAGYSTFTTGYDDCILDYANRKLTKGPTSYAPVGVDKGFQYFDTTRNKPVWWNGAEWVDALGRLAGDTYNEVRHNINGTEIKVISTDAESQGLSIYAPTELENDGYVVVQQDNKAKFVDPADIGLK